MSDVDTTLTPDRSRFEAHLEGELAGVVEYELHEGTIELTHTRVEDRFEGKGVGSALARGALDRIRAGEEPLGQRQVVATCTFISGWIDKHPEYADLLAGTDEP